MSIISNAYHQVVAPKTYTKGPLHLIWPEEFNKLYTQINGIIFHTYYVALENKLC